ncbi:hypothetical protein BT93_K0440 [Corymbia citriodora subsp. variegata]|nr:hypothetical protein BT93_K0440 [Corymbia citriodora subsp. variegata]
MVFSSLPAYLDPSNWQQQPNHHHHQAGNSGLSTQLAPAPPPPPPPPQPHGGAGGNPGGSIRPGSMVERARMANIPMPEASLKCPRCDSSNTKFCYFNNYSLSQPRHFCKTCRRYWTRGGALRNVPVGGGCRRNKRSKGSSSKSPITSGSSDQQASGGSTSSTSRGSGGLAGDMLSRATAQIPGLRYMSPSSLSSLGELGNSGEMGLNYGGIPGSMVGDAGNLSFQLGGNSSLLSMGSIEHQWRLHQVTQQFPFMSSLDKPTNLYQMDGSTSGVEPSGLAGHHHHQVRPNLFMNSGASQMSSVKVEDINQDQLNLSRQLMGNSGGNDQFWSVGGGGTGGSSAWTDLSGFSSSSTSNAL